jgi:flagellar motor switch protein FliG
VLKLMTERQRNEVLVRVATLDGIQPTALKDLNDVMSKVLAGGDRMKKANLGGVKAAAEILNLMGSASRPRCSTSCARATTTWRRRSWTTCSPSTTW